MGSGIDGKYGEITSSKQEFHPGEPIFLLRAQDPLAPEAVDRYADLCASRGCAPEHVAAARRHANRIRAWQEGNPELVKALPGPSPEEATGETP